jgi:hypothetical protein
MLGPLHRDWRACEHVVAGGRFGTAAGLARVLVNESLAKP